MFATLKSKITFFISGIYYAPLYDTISEYRQYIEDLPQNDEPEIFGMHENANIAFQTQETNALITTILEVQPRTSSGGVGKSNDDIATDLCENILGKLMDKLDIEQASQDMFQVQATHINSVTLTWHFQPGHIADTGHSH